MSHFRHKALADLLASLTGALGLHRLYLGQRFWWLPLAVTLMALPLIIGVDNWYQTPAFFALMVPVIRRLYPRTGTRADARRALRRTIQCNAVKTQPQRMGCGADCSGNVARWRRRTQTYFEYALKVRS